MTVQLLEDLWNKVEARIPFPSCDVPRQTSARAEAGFEREPTHRTSSANA